MLATMSKPPALIWRGALPESIASFQSFSAAITAGELKPLLPSAVWNSPPPCHMNGYQVKFW